MHTGKRTQKKEETETNAILMGAFVMSPPAMLRFHSDTEQEDKTLADPIAKLQCRDTVLHSRFSLT